MAHLVREERRARVLALERLVFRLTGHNGSRRLAEAELLRVDGVADVGLAHVGVDGGQRHVEVEVEVEDDPRDKYDEDGEGGILKVGQLHLHRPELGAPADVRVARERCLWRRRLPADGLPVGRLDVLKVVCLGVVVQLDALAVNDERITDEEVGDVARQDIVHPRLDKRLVRLLVDRRVDVVELLGARVVVLAGQVVADEARDGVVA
mmetsp:Transcript_23032/g.74589  ORF Transcript_23032/g.74589 Transcript_23032/m.74589 type:complete len:208 (-) Transcript_23032:1499-2122(-)